MPRRSSGSPPGKADSAEIRFAEVTRATRADFEELFEQPGAPKYCWCMAWRHYSREHVRNAEKKRMMMGLIEAGTPVGIVAEVDGKPVGWCSVAPRETYRRLSKVQDDSETGVWSIVCFYVPRALRGGGVAAALLDAAIDHAFDRGARVIEAYPVDQAAPSYRFMGFRDMFLVRGFHEIGTAGSRRHVMRLER
ncbi:MAG: GNAT family N-acetyltransferase [Mesorhizobium sp.]|uniref:GNAT family N-acetyltransferase n=1 Tax=Mesorhizobium sp. TaxID=1871066 RepID=UPI000FD372DC|nr:GNAT family N-acetyltransferase [Mesorhizobium sp.]RVC64344.1 GNAT family N-acetyltransferase [Mesorhizobium sp. M4B.F.Ca.ET.088.02.2.1]RWF32492.1 MAG: GNAT family N-acetyltransferase [Mesorhizobium sp.]RWF41651.1 MAG: GNAT family N-acetyltransferase [Mesorhizobium sp.]TIX10793.1 MAG: GNAT family N-acetyltransferase [Mesorhizobium sp.]TJW08588.1 MAG: GNAT family N-acetyltransferase [Mesorhizobium sp.]